MKIFKLYIMIDHDDAKSKNKKEILNLLNLL